MTEIEAFIDYAIKERCEGCKDCDPKSRESQSVVCMEQGFAHWLMYTGQRWQKERRDCKTCAYSKDGHYQAIEECHICMWTDNHKSMEEGEA